MKQGCGSLQNVRLNQRFGSGTDYKCLTSQDVAKVFIISRLPLEMPGSGDQAVKIAKAEKKDFFWYKCLTKMYS